jgi:hypothetical protein
LILFHRVENVLNCIYLNQPIYLKGQRDGISACHKPQSFGSGQVNAAK